MSGTGERAREGSPLLEDRHLWRSPPLAALSGVRHGFFGRRGGVSGGLYASLNAGLGSGDRRESVVENRRRVAQTQGVAPPCLLTLRQSHSARAVVARDDSAGGEPGDALATDRPGLALGVLTADCAPVLLADGAAGVVAAAHAGWRGALGGIVESALAAMERLGARRRDTVAVVGPCIGQASYLVGAEFRTRFVTTDEASRRFFVPAPGRPGRHRFDLAGYVLARLRAGGVGLAAAVGGDSCAEEDRFFSYRRSLLRVERDYGRQLSVIGLAPPVER